MIDKMMEKYGYHKTEENKHGVYYEKLEPQGYTHIVCVTAKNSGRHLMQSYDKKVIRVPGPTYGNECVGVEIPVLILMWLKAKYLTHKYHWNKGDRDK